MNNLKNAFSSLANRSILITLILGFSSGLPLALTSSTLKAWYATTSVSLVSISFVAFAALPYTFKFLWAPFMDRFVPPFLGRRRGWIVICQLALCLFIAGMALLSPSEEPRLLVALACIVAFLSASQDIAIDAYRVDLLHPDERPMGAAMGVNGYRIAMLVSGGLVLILAEYFGWRFAYLMMSVILAVTILASVWGPESEKNIVVPKTLWDSTVLPFKDFLMRPQAVAILCFIALYKLGDAFAGAFSQTFLIRAVHMSLVEIGTLIKISGFFGTVVGTMVGAMWIPKLGWFRSLYIFGIMQAVANLMYMPLIWTGPNYLLAGNAIFIDNLFGGMATAAFAGLLMSLCNVKFSAFQYSLFSALSAVGRVFISPVAGSIAEHYGWASFFLSSLLFAAPGLILLFWIRNDFSWNSSEAEKPA